MDDNSLPYPDCLIPPKGNLGSDFTKSFTKHKPASKCFLAISSPLILSRVNTAAPRPNSVWLAKESASVSSFAFITENTGPKISSSKAAIPGLTSTSNVMG